VLPIPVTLKYVDVTLSEISVIFPKVTHFEIALRYPLELLQNVFSFHYVAAIMTT